MHNLYLTAAIISEVIATSFLKSSKGFTVWGPSLIILIGYSASFYFLSLSLEKIPVGVAYAIWSGVGIVLISIVGALFQNQVPDVATLVGTAFIVAGVVIIQTLSNTATTS